MNISFAHLLLTVALYGACVGVTIACILHLRRRARFEDASRSSAVLAVLRDVIVLAVLPLAASIVVWFGPSLVRGFFGGDAAPAVAEVQAFAVAQGIWSVPSACFYVLAMRLLRERFSLHRIIGGSLLVLVALGGAALVSRSGLPTFVAGVVAQVVGGVLPMSAAASLPPNLSIAIDGRPMVHDWSSVSALRAGVLCAGVVLGYWLLESRRSAAAA